MQYKSSGSIHAKAEIKLTEVSSRVILLIWSNRCYHLAQYHIKLVTFMFDKNITMVYVLHLYSKKTPIESDVKKDQANLVIRHFSHHCACGWCTVYPKKYAHGLCLAVLCCGYTLTDFPISIRLTSLALWQSNDCPSASKATLMNMDKHLMWIYYERLHNHYKAKHNKTVCIFLGIYCTGTWRVHQQMNYWGVERHGL